jgi:hypothetical protein
VFGEVVGKGDIGSRPKDFLNGRRWLDIGSVGAERCEQIVEGVLLVIAPQHDRESLTG